jgi:hypothetical protein
MAITVDKEGTSHFRRTSYPMRFGKYSEITTSEYEFQFNLKGEIKYIRGLSANWPHPSEWMKRTDGNDWIFYSVRPVSNYKVIDWLGEYYLPCLPYRSNSIWEFNPFTDSNILKAFAAWTQLYANIHQMPRDRLPSEIREFFRLVSDKDEKTLYDDSKKLHSITRGRISVLPPDTRHVEYEVIPLIIADGCLYHCGFCSVKSRQRFQPRSAAEILQQINDLKDFYDRNLGNYNALFLGNHDALAAGEELICTAASEAYRIFEFGTSQFNKNPLLFLFGSVDSLINAGNAFLQKLNSLPFYTYINIGFESADPPTLAHIRKPLEVNKIRDAFQKMLEINRNYANIEITGNFLMGEQFSPEHNQSLAELLSSVPDPYTKGAVYLSPLMDSRKRLELLKLFFEIKKQSRLPAYIYLIQQL